MAGGGAAALAFRAARALALRGGPRSASTAAPAREPAPEPPAASPSLAASEAEPPLRSRRSSLPPPPAVDFEDTREAFRSKSSGELARAFLVLGLCSIGPLVDHADKLMHLSQKLLSQGLFEKLMKLTFYGQFVAGEDQEAIKPLIRHNQAHGVGSILDYSVEEDLTTEEAEKKELE